MHPGWVVAGGSLVMVLVAVGFHLVAGRETPIDHPDTWDPRVVEYVAWVEQERGLKFEHPVHVEFLTPAQYSRAMRIDPQDLAGAQWDQLFAQEAALRTMGLLAPDVDLFSLNNELLDVGTLAVYTPEDRTVRVRGTTIDVGVEVTLVHELVHAAQDQHFDLGRLGQQRDGGAALAFRAVVEGDATFTANRYLDSLPVYRQWEYFELYGQYLEDADLGAYLEPAMLIYGAAYNVGPYLVEMAYERGGWEAVNQMLIDPPTSELELLDPRLALDRFEPQRVEPPAPYTGETVVSEADFGAMHLYFSLASRIDALVALEAAEAWVGGSQTVSRSGGGRVCVTIRIRTASGGEKAMETALAQWQRAMPASANASASIIGDDARIRTCDPRGRAGDPSFGASTANVVLTLRVVTVTHYLGQGESVETVDCIVDLVAEDQVEGWIYAAAEAQSGAVEPWAGEVDPQIVQRCRGDSA